MSLRQKKYAAFAVMLGVPLLLVLAGAGLEHAGVDAYEVLAAAAILAVAAGMGLHLLWIRCPHCGSWLERNDGDYCQSCGKRIDWDGKPGKE